MTNDEAPMTKWLAAKCLAALVVVAFALALSTMPVCAEAPLESRLALIRAAGDPASIADLAPAAIPDDENAAVFLERMGARLSEFSTDHAHFSDTPVGQGYDQGQDGASRPLPSKFLRFA
jgi:hypothetical protein